MMLHPSPVGTQACVSTACQTSGKGGFGRASMQISNFSCDLETCRRKVVMKQNVKLFASGDIALFLLLSSDKYLLSLQAEVKMLSVSSMSLV